MARILIIDTYYPEFLKSLPFDVWSTYEVELRKVLDKGFGTSDFVSRHLREREWDAIDVIANHGCLQQQWAGSHKLPFYKDTQRIALAQINYFQPDVLFLQDLSYFTADALRELSNKYLLAGQCSCPLPAYENVKAMDVIFTSFPHFLQKFDEAGVKAVYLPLAFEPSVLQSQPERDIEISSVGGAGRNSHWKAGTDTLELIASEFKERFHWYGYGLENLPASSALRACYRGEAWGRDMYAVYQRSKIVVNRHGEVADGYANNLRMFESTGCGAMLLTERAPNLSQFFTGNEAITYGSPEEAVHAIRHYLARPNELAWVALNGQYRTLKEHTYRQRMGVVSDVLKEMLVVA